MFSNHLFAIAKLTRYCLNIIAKRFHFPSAGILNRYYYCYYHRVRHGFCPRSPTLRQVRKFQKASFDRNPQKTTGICQQISKTISVINILSEFLDFRRIFQQKNWFCAVLLVAQARMNTRQLVAKAIKGRIGTLSPFCVRCLVHQLRASFLCSASEASVEDRHDTSHPSNIAKAGVFCINLLPQLYLKRFKS